MASTNGAHNGHAVLTTRAGVTDDLLARHTHSGRAFRTAAVVCGALLALGVVGLIMRLTDGVSVKALWGYYAMVFAFILTTAQAAPMVAIAARIGKGQWRRPISRAAELWTAVGLFNLILFIPMLWVLPSLEDERRSLWFWRAGEGIWEYTPHLWATLALLGLVVIGLALLWLSALPDLALVRDRGTGWKQRWAARLSGRWAGTSRQWHILERRMGITGALYFMMLVFVHFLISTDFLMTLVPGWIDALFPVTHAANSLQAGVATVVLTMFFLRRFGGYKDYIAVDQFWTLGKLMFALSLLWFWFWFSSFIVLWYGKKPNEQAALELLMVGPYVFVFMAVFVLNFLLPLATMVWNPVRKSVWGPTIIASSVLLGTFFDRIRLYVAAYSADEFADAGGHAMSLAAVKTSAARLPEAADVFIVLGALGGSVLVYLLVSRLIPVMNIWEQKELLLYKIHKPFHRTEVMVLGKPE